MCAHSSACPEVATKVLDEAAVVQTLSPKLTETFDEYFDNIIIVSVILIEKP